MMLINKPPDIKSSEITPESVYRQRRLFMKSVAAGVAMLASPSLLAIPNYPKPGDRHYPGPEWLQQMIRQGSNERVFATDEPMTPYVDVTGHNNFYEFGIGKRDPLEHAQEFRTDPWKVEISGEVSKPGQYTLEDILKPHTLEERIYRLRCVEAWSMVIPWIGFPLGDLLKRFEPTGNAHYVEFVTLHDPEQMPGQRSSFSTIRWPYVEGLRMDEAMHPLTIMAVGVYGDALPPQNGAPLRLVVPWKYGFKSIKSIVAIRFHEQMPDTSWNLAAPNEYGFYANVNPQVNHPRWSQATERRLPSPFFNPNRIDTQLFNGYAEEVASLYQGMDLRQWF